MRLFYAVFLPEEVRAALVEAQTKVRPFRGWKPVPPHQLHLTLLFLGERPEEELPDYLALGHRLARLEAPFRARLRGTGYFPNEGTPRVWFAKAEAEGFLRLAEGLRAGVEELLGEEAVRIPGWDKPFKPHITLARNAALTEQAPPPPQARPWMPEGLTLYHSHRMEGVLVYTALDKWPVPAPSRRGG